MFVGHYGPAFAAKPAQKQVPLWLLFVAVQWMDFCWAALVLLGVEKARIVPGFVEGSSMDLYYMPYTHGLIGASVLALAFGVVVAQFFPGRKALTTAVLAGAVFSHWLLDLIVHVRDLPLIGDTMKVGFGLWHHVAISLPLELLILVAGAVIYDRGVPSGIAGRIALSVFVAVLAAFQVYANLRAAPPTPQAEAAIALGAYVVLALIAGGVEATRRIGRKGAVS